MASLGVIAAATAAVAVLAVSVFFGAATVNPDSDTLAALLAAYAVAALLGGSALLAGAMMLAREFKVVRVGHTAGMLGLAVLGLSAFTAAITSAALTAVIGPTTVIVGTAGISLGLGSLMARRWAYGAWATGLVTLALIVVGTMRSV